MFKVNFTSHMVYATYATATQYSISREPLGLSQVVKKGTRETITGGANKKAIPLLSLLSQPAMEMPCGVSIDCGQLKTD